MSTRSTIAMELEPGHPFRFRSIYCHWDGHLFSNGRTLLKHYRSRERVSDLIRLGSLSVLGEELGGPHPLNWRLDDAALALRKNAVELWPEPYRSYNRWCGAFHRDGGNNWEHCKPSDHADLAALIESAEEYLYVFGLDCKWRTLPRMMRSLKRRSNPRDSLVQLTRVMCDKEARRYGKK